MQTAEIVIIGGGVIGLTTAYFLARDGADVLLLDRGDLGQEASWAGAGILPPSDVRFARTPFDQLRAKSLAMFPPLSAELRGQTGIDNGYLRCGGLEFRAENSHAAAEHEWRGEGVACELVPAHQLPKIEPHVTTQAGDAWHLPDMAQIRNPRHLKALIAACEAKVRFLRNCPVAGLETAGQRVTGVRTAQGILHAGRVLLAAGAWTDGLLESLGVRLGVQPVRGQIALLHMPLALRSVLMRGTSYVVPRGDGHVLIGSTEEWVGFDKRTTAAAIQGLLALACRLVPALADATLVRSWAGFRPGSPDGLPFLGSVPGWDNLFVAAGHFRHGIQLAAASALAMKELLVGETATVALDAFAVGRKPAT